MKIKENVFVIKEKIVFALKVKRNMQKKMLFFMHLQMEFLLYLLS